MPSLYSPNPQRQSYTENVVAGRKFYYHFTKAVDEGDEVLTFSKEQTIPLLLV